MFFLFGPRIFESLNGFLVALLDKVFYTMAQKKTKIFDFLVVLCLIKPGPNIG